LARSPGLLYYIFEYFVINVPLTVFLSLILASALNSAIPFRTFFRAAYYVPYVTASVAALVASILCGTSIVRVHAVRAAVEAARVADAVLAGGMGAGPA